jgi:hypothetical protein
MITSLKACPFCGSHADGLRDTAHLVVIHIARCANRDCIASFKSVDAEVWNTRATTAEMFDDPEFWLLVRRFTVAPIGEKRDAAKQAVLSFVGRML